MLRCNILDSDKRIWIYAGLVAVAGVGLVTVAARKYSAPSLPGGAVPPVPPQNGSVPALQPLFAPIRQGDRLLLVGDSLAQGLSMPFKQLAGDMSVAFFGDGRVSTRIDQWAAQPWLMADVSSFGPTIVLISLGTNDMKLSNPSAEQKALDSLVKNLKNTGATTIWLIPPTMPFADNGVRTMIGNAGNVFRSDLLSIPRGPDGIHPTTAGYAGWAGAIWRFLLRGGITSLLRPVVR